MSGKNKKLITGLLVIVLLLIVGPSLALKSAEFGGSDDTGNVMVEEIAGEYKLRFTPVLEILINGGLPGEIGSLLFCVQTDIGVGILTFCMGHLIGRKKWADRENKMTAQGGRKDIIFRFPIVWLIRVNRLIQKSADALKSQSKEEITRSLKKSDVQQGAGHQNGGFHTSIEFVLAYVGSAAGMGNTWVFPYRMGQYGGTAFLAPYILSVVLFELVRPSTEFAMGRRAKTGTLRAYEYCQKSRNLGKLGYVLGWMPLIGSLGVAIGHTIIVDWVIRSFAGSPTGEILMTDAAKYFGRATGNSGNIPWHVVMILIACGLLMFGTTKGIKKVSRVLMPSLFILFAILAVRVTLLPEAVDGYKFLFVLKWEALLKVNTWVMAIGQAFFSLSITGSGMIVYGTYLSKSEDIPKASIRTAFFDAIAAMLSALVIMPAVFTLGIKPNAGPPLMLITLPNIFKQMPMGRLSAVLFFLSVTFAGITSLINMFETVGESWQTRFQLARRRAAALCGGMALLVGIFLETEPKVGSWMDFITIIVVPFGAVLGTVPIYYTLGFDEIKEELGLGRDEPLGRYFGPLAKYVYVPLAIIVFILGLVYGGIG